MALKRHPDTAINTEYDVTFVTFSGMESIEVYDPIERHRYTLSTQHAIDPVDIDPSVFQFPVETAIEVATDHLELPSVVALYVRDGDGRLAAEAEQFADVTVPPGNYVVEINAPIKLYLEVESAIEITSDLDTMNLNFGSVVDVAIGARSTHERPAGTVTTTAAPEDLMAAVSTFGSALKSTSPERSFPTLRGHPPTVEMGDSLEIPRELAAPETGITIELRPNLAEIFQAGSVAFYLGATVVRGPTPRIVTDDGYVHNLEATDGIGQEMERVLKQVFLLDCVTRTEGLYPVALDERRRLESRVSLDFQALYDQPIGQRLESYLQLPYSTVADLVPRWGLAAHMRPDPSAIELLPYLVDDLALVQVHQEAALERSAGSASSKPNHPPKPEAFTRSSDGVTVSQSPRFVRPPNIDAAEQVWLGDGTPIGASKAVKAAYENRLDRSPTRGDIDITVICNDRRMNTEEGLIEEIYGSREDLAFDLSFHRDLTRASLREVLHTQTDFVHYIGHIDGEGFECADGKLDAATMDDAAVDSFLLNACESYAQGRHLIEAGSIGGIVTLSDVINESAIKIGRTLAQLLNSGFPLYAALGIAERESLMGGRYIVVGDGRMALTQPKSVPYLCEMTANEPSRRFEYITYPTSRIDLGSMFLPHLGENDLHSLVSNRVSASAPSQAELSEFFSLENVPVRSDGDLCWSYELIDQ